MQLPLSIPISRDHLLARLLCRGDAVSLELRGDGRLGIVRCDGTRVEAELLPATTVLTWLVVLRYRSDGRSESLVLPSVATGAEAHRRLRVWLNARAVTGAGA